MRVAMGIDVGWSKRRRTCAVAIKGLAHDAFQNYAAGRGQPPVQVGCFNLEGLLGFIPGFVAQHRRELEDAVMVVDGPLWPGDVVSRPVDALFSRGTFQGLLQASDVSLDTPEAVKYRETTDLIIRAFRKAGLALAPWFGGDLPPTSVVAETNPTVAMALLLKRQDPANVPSRRRPFALYPFNAPFSANGQPAPGTRPERVIRAKSDWYWYLGAKTAATEMLRADVEREIHHERSAGLVCLALAWLLTGQHDRLRAAAVGGANGSYVIADHVHPDWRNELQKHLTGNVLWEGPAVAAPDRTCQRYSPSGQAHVGAVDPQNKLPELTEERRSSLRDDVVELFLGDDGGTWSSHNAWLSDFGEGASRPKTLELQALDQAGGPITLSPADNPRMWTSQPTNRQLRLARRVPACLSMTNSLVIPVELR